MPKDVPALLKLLVIGCGSIGERHIRNLLALQGVTLAACDPDAGRRDQIRRAYGIEVFPNHRAALKSGFDAALVCTPTAAHIGCLIKTRGV